MNAMQLTKKGKSDFPGVDSRWPLVSQRRFFHVHGKRKRMGPSEILANLRRIAVATTVGKIAAAKFPP